MVQVRISTLNQIREQVTKAHNNFETAQNVAQTLQNIITNTPGDDPTPLPINHPVQPFNNIPFYLDDPNQPADPTDCNSYPDSPFCGGNPIGNKFTELQPEIIADGCNLGVRLNGTVGFIKMPPVNFIYRNPACTQGSLPAYPIDLPTDPSIPSLNLPSIPLNQRVKVFFNIKVESTSIVYHPVTDITNEWSIGKTQSVQALSWGQIVCPGTDDNLVDGEVSYSSSYLATGGRGNGNNFYPNDPISENYIGNTYGHFFKNTSDPVDSTWMAELTYNGYARGGYTPPGKGGLIGLLYGNWGIIKSLLEEQVRLGNKSINSETVESTYIHNQITTISIQKILFDNCSETYQIIPPPPPQKPHMTCCNDDLVRLLIQKVDKLSEVVGVSEYPATVPSSLISTTAGFLGNTAPNPNIEITSLTKLFEWYIKQFDALFGEWEIPIQIKDIDSNKNEKTQIVKLPNIAEAVAEIFLMLVNINVNSEVLINANTRLSLEAAQDKIQNYKTWMLTNAIADYLGFKHKDVTQKLPMLFDIGKEHLVDLLNNTEIDVLVQECDDSTNLQKIIPQLIKAARIIDMVFFRKAEGDDVKQQIINKVKKQSESSKPPTEKFQEFVKEVEDGFTKVPGVSDPSHPYGVDPNHRPQIKIISQEHDQ